MHLHFVHNEILDVKHWNDIERCNDSIYLLFCLFILIREKNYLQIKCICYHVVISVAVWEEGDPIYSNYLISFITEYSVSYLIYRQ